MYSATSAVGSNNETPCNSIGADGGAGKTFAFSSSDFFDATALPPGGSDVGVAFGGATGFATVSGGGETVGLAVLSASAAISSLQRTRRMDRDRGTSAREIRAGIGEQDRAP